MTVRIYRFLSFAACLALAASVTASAAGGIKSLGGGNINLVASSSSSNSGSSSTSSSSVAATPLTAAHFGLTDADYAALPSTYVDERLHGRPSDAMAPVEVFAGNFIGMAKDPLAHHPVRVYIDTYDDSKAVTMKTDAGGFMQLSLAVGSKVFMTAYPGNNYHETTTAVATVPPEGLTGLYGRIVFQVPTDLIYALFSNLIGRKMPVNTCPVVVTITQYNTTYDVAPQGWEGVEATILPASAAVGDARPYYFGMTPSHGTDPLPNNRTTTSPDGGVVFPAIPLNPDEDVIIGAKYKDYPFSTATVRCLRPGQFINAAPNQGPKALKKLE